MRFLHPRRFANAAALLFVLIAGFLIALGVVRYSAFDFKLAFFALLAAFASIQLRIRAGGRAKRTPLLYFHIAAAVPFLLSVVGLAFMARPLWLLYAMAAFGLFAAVSGSMVFLRPASA